MFERPEKGELAVLVHVNLDDKANEEDLNELQELVLAAGASPVAVIQATRRTPDAKYFVGTGKVEEIKNCVTAYQADVVLFNHSLTPAQERNLERYLQCRCLDRTGLILDIFAQRARTFEGKLQVELAQLKHLSTRLVRGWTHLERQKGGIGLRGPGETQLETDRRLLRGRIKYIKDRLDKVLVQRAQGRRSRKRSNFTSISLVGYTNAGKSTLFSRFTDSDVYVADQLFATLDPTLRKRKIAKLGQVIISDTVGFIRHLPHDLVDAFRATLEETVEADLLLHVIDAHSENRRDQIAQVEAVLAEIGADDRPCLEVYNKIDLLSLEPKIERDQLGKPKRVWLSALQNQGLDLLEQAIAEVLSEQIIQKTLKLSPDEGQLRAKLYELGGVVAERTDDEGDIFLTIRLARETFNRLFYPKT